MISLDGHKKKKKKKVQKVKKKKLHSLESVSKKSSKTKDLIKSKKAPINVVKTYDVDEFNQWLATTPGFIEGLTENNAEETSLYDYQVDFMLDQHNFKLVNKSRQTGFSFVIAANSLAKSQLQRVYRAIYISINREEASNKIDYARSLYESLPLKFQKKQVVNNKFSLEFEEPNGKNRTTLTSLAQRGPRGPGHNTDVFLDEFAHFHWGKEIYLASLPVISRGNSGLSILSTPFGNKGQFADIYNDRNTYADFKIYDIPWWHCSEFCLDVGVAMMSASTMPTYERVNKLATSKLKQIFKNMDWIDFQQEYECAFIDEATAYYPLKLIKANTFKYESDEWLDEVGVDVENTRKYEIQEKYPNVNFDLFFDNVEDLLLAVQSQKISKNLCAGYDVGRTKDTSELAIIEEISVDGKILKVVRCMVQLRNMPFREQKAFLNKLLKADVLDSMYIDATGLGMNLAEDLEYDYSSTVEPITFTGLSKSVMAKKVKVSFEDQKLAIPDNVNIIKQIHSIRRKVTLNSNEQFEADKGDGKQHHADKFWSIALAVHAGTPPMNYVDYDGAEYEVDGERIMEPLTGKNRVDINPPDFSPIVGGRSSLDNFLNNPLGNFGDVPSDLDGIDLGGRRKIN